MTGCSIAETGALADLFSVSNNLGNDENPVLALIHQHMNRRGVDRRALGHLIAGSGNLSKAFRRLDELLRGERFLPVFVGRVATALGIPEGELAVAAEAHEKWESDRLREERKRAAEEAMKRRGPHLWGLMPPKYRPSLITILGPEFFLLNRLPEDIVELPDYEQMREVGRLVRECYANDRRCQLIGYEYRRSLHEVFHFGVDGEFLGRIEEPPVECEAFVRIGNRTIKTPCSLLFGGGGN